MNYRGEKSRVKTRLLIAFAVVAGFILTMFVLRQNRVGEWKSKAILISECQKAALAAKIHEDFDRMLMQVNSEGGGVNDWVGSHISLVADRCAGKKLVLEDGELKLYSGERLSIFEREGAICIREEVEVRDAPESTDVLVSRSKVSLDSEGICAGYK